MRFASPTLGEPKSARETSDFDTSARAATSRMLGLDADMN